MCASVALQIALARGMVSDRLLLAVASNQFESPSWTSNARIIACSLLRFTLNSRLERGASLASPLAMECSAVWEILEIVVVLRSRCP